MIVILAALSAFFFLYSSYEIIRLRRTLVAYVSGCGLVPAMADALLVAHYWRELGGEMRVIGLAPLAGILAVLVPMATVGAYILLGKLPWIAGRDNRSRTMYTGDNACVSLHSAGIFRPGRRPKGTC